MTAPAAAILGCAGTTLAPDEAAFFRAARPWGLILFARNVESPAQVRRLIADLHDAIGTEAPVFIDQEGGRVQRLRAPHWREWPDPLVQVRAAGPNAARVIELRYRLIADELRAVGITGNCAPTCDIAGPITHPFLHDRCLGAAVPEVVANARAAARGLQAGGILAVAKHIPGHGGAAADSHLSLPVVTTPAESLIAQDFAPFRALSDLPLAMTAHVLYTALDPDLPATLSARIIGMIRSEIGFDGLLMTDDLSMGALAGAPGDLAAASLRAGCDVALHCNGRLPEMEAVVAACGALAGKALQRAGAATRWAAPNPAPFDPSEAMAELAALLPADG